MESLRIKKFREDQIKLLPDTIGVYALVDVNETVRYVGQTTDGIRKRVQRHLTSARSDIIANRQIDVSEIAFVWAYPCLHKDAVTPLENTLIHFFNDKVSLMNGKLPPRPNPPSTISPPKVIQIMPQALLEARREDLSEQMVQHAEAFYSLALYASRIKSNKDICRSLNARLALLNKQTQEFIDTVIKL